MEDDSNEDSPGKNNGSSKNFSPSVSDENVEISRNLTAPASRYRTIAEVNMEASISAEDLIRAGGFAATDAIASILPVASDATDYEGHLIEVQEYENVEDTDNASNDAYDTVNVGDAATCDEMIRAGGFGATDDINSILPVASDFTDFEAHLRDAQDYEDRDKEVDRHGLGWIKETE